MCVCGVKIVCVLLWLKLILPPMQFQDGLVCIAVSCARKGAKNTGKEIKNIYVAPQDLRLPENDREWEDALAYILV